MSNSDHLSKGHTVGVRDDLPVKLKALVQNVFGHGEISGHSHPIKIKELAPGVYEVEPQKIEDLVPKLPHLQIPSRANYREM